SSQVIVKTHYVTLLRLLYPQANIDDVRKALIATNNNLTNSKTYLQRLGYKEAKTPAKAATPDGQTEANVKKTIVTSSKPTVTSSKLIVVTSKSPNATVTQKKAVMSPEVIMTSKPITPLYTKRSCANGPNPALPQGPDPTLPQGPNKLNLSS
uniref:Uncharacterized protein n=1 Tax=Ciona intestinalis TaxID=7719 RepID=H2Y388_CIOIN